MQLVDIRTEVLNKGFDPTLFGTARINRFINDGYMLICRRTQFWAEESTNDFNTVNGTPTYALPANLARVREVWDTNRSIALAPVGLREIDTSAGAQTGAPQAYALDGNNIRVWPVPDGIYPLELRYWATPPLLVADADVPILPDDWQHLLWVYAAWQCYESEDDPSMGQYWMGRFNNELAEFQADQKFRDSEFPWIAKGMWDADRPLQQKGWSLWGWL